jgi:hypothetical protein
MKRFGLVVLLWTVSAAAQNVQLMGGDSSLFRAEGASARLLFANSETSISGGVINGQTFVGVVEKFTTHGWTVDAGDITLPFKLVTDFTPTTTQYPAVGAVISRTTGNRTLTLFTGATATAYQVPFVFGSRAETPTAGIFYEQRMSQWTFTSAEVVSTGKQSAIQSLQFRPTDATSFAVAAGVGNNSPFVGLRAGYETQRLVGVVAWTKRGAGFQRVVIPNYSVTENNGLEARGSYLTRHFNVTADRQNLLSSIRGTVVNSTVESVSTGASTSLLSGSATGFYGRTNGQVIRGMTAGIGGTVGPVTARYDWYLSQGRMSQSVSVIEKLTRHFSVNEFIQAHSVNAGAEYHSNTLTASGGYSMSFFPALGIFQKVLSVSLSVQLPHNLRLDAQTVTTPDGRVRWTAYATTYQNGPLSDIQLGSNHTTGKYSYIVKFVTPDGEPIAGAATIGRVETFANQRGFALVPTNKKAAKKPLTILVDDFPAAGRYRVVSAPTDITPEVPAEVVVERM